MQNNVTNARNTTAQLEISFHRHPGRPLVSANRKRQTRSITLSPHVIDDFTLWTDKNDLSFSRGVEKAIRLLMKGGADDANF